jgi:putative membrane protein
LDTADANASRGVLLARAGLGGVLMGLANLVPGISGGTMLLAAGVYPAFVGAIAELSTLRLRMQSILVAGTVSLAAALAILFLAGAVKTLVIERRWLMYSLFLGLTLGGVPLVWRLVRPLTLSAFAGAAGGVIAMLAMAFGLGAAGRIAEASALLLMLSGLAGASAMILPGVSGGYLLLLLGQYEVILGAIDALKRGLVASPLDSGLVWDAMQVVIPVGIGVVVGVVAVSNLLRWLLEHAPKPTLGVLLGLLLGAVVGLWPFQAPRQPREGELIGGRVIAAGEQVPPEDWPLERFVPSGGQIAAALGMALGGLGATLLLGRLGGPDEV